MLVMVVMEVTIMFLVSRGDGGVRNTGTGCSKGE